MKVISWTIIIILQAILMLVGAAWLEAGLLAYIKFIDLIFVPYYENYTGGGHWFLGIIPIILFVTLVSFIFVAIYKCSVAISVTSMEISLRKLFRKKHGHEVLA